MHNTIPDLLRKSAIDSIFDTNTFKGCWSTWKPKIQQILGSNFSETDILNLGDELSNIFKSTGGGGRGQGELSAGGTAWESLVCWYINICTATSRVVAIKKMSLVPVPIQDAITVNYGNFACNTESDITVITFPDLPEYKSDVNTLIVHDDSGTIIPTLVKGKLNPKLVNYLAQRDFHLFGIGVIQCKTNWNDNAQIPMLWDMIYSAGGFRGRNITIGRNTYSIQNCKNFTYSFVTVPSNVNTTYKSNSVSVKRVTNLSGGNYWGKQTEANIAKSLKEIFTNNFQDGAISTLRVDLRNCIPHINSNGKLNYFGL